VLTLPEPCVVVLVGPGAAGTSTWAQTHFAATGSSAATGFADHIGRFRQLADAGVREAMVRLPDPACTAPMAEVMAAFR
jgi:hypothetical protein